MSSAATPQPSLARKISEVLAATVAAVGFLASAAACAALAFGIGQNSKDPVGSILSVTRGLAGAVSGFVLAAAIELFLHRRKLDHNADVTTRLERRLNTLESYVTPEIDGLLRKREQLSPWVPTLRGRKTLSISGMSLRTFTMEQLGSLDDMLRQGGSCRVVLIEPKSPASSVAAKHFDGRSDPAEYDKDVTSSLVRLGRLKAKHPQALMVRTIDHVPAASIAMLDDGTPSAQLFVELYTYESSSATRPHLELAPKTSPQWYFYFSKQFEKIWDNSKADTFDSIMSDSTK